jgi:hypothetical protein
LFVNQKIDLFKKQLGRHKLLILICIGFTYCLTSVKYLRYFSQAGDGASYVGLVASARRNLHFDPYLYASILKMNQNAWSGSDAWCASDSVFSLPGKSSVLQWHAYLVAYPLGWISRLTHISPAYIAALAESATVVCAVGIAAHALWKVSGHKALIVGFIACVLSMPILRIGFSGQLQPERLFVLPVILILCQLERSLNSERISKLTVVAAYLFGASISERCAFTLAWLTVIYFVLRAPKFMISKPFSNIFYWCAVICFGWWWYWSKYIQDSFFYKQISIKAISSGLRLSFTDDLSNTIRMLVVLSPLIVLSIFRWQGAVLGFLSLIPNLAVSVGGAEKTDYYTHYHAIYFAVFFGGAVLGMLQISKSSTSLIVRPKLNIVRFRVLNVLLAACLVLNLSYSGNNLFSPSQIKKNLIASSASYGLAFGGYRENLSDASREWRTFTDGIPISASISAPEWIMPALVDEGHLKISYYPLGVTTADVIFAEYDSQIGQLSFLPWIMDQTEASKIGLCITSAIERRNQLTERDLLKPDLLRIRFKTIS